MNFAAWLGDFGLERYADVFQENAIDAEVLPELSDADLEKLGVLLGHRRKLLKAIAQLKAASALPAAAAIAADPPEATGATEAERRQLTVMFVDLVGSTELASKLDPEDMREVIRAYQNAVAGEIARFEGYVNFMGDGVLACFGWPKAHEDEAERAVRAGLAVSATVGPLAAPDGQALVARIGIATGLVVVGDLAGESATQEEAVVGETPNLAARLQALAPPGQVVIAGSTRRLLGDVFELSDLGAKCVKGIAEPVQVFAVRGERVVESRFDARCGSALLPMVGRDQELALLHTVA